MLKLKAAMTLETSSGLWANPGSQMEGRGEFARDRARVLHSAAFRKLSAKTQVLSPSSGTCKNKAYSFAEVAQVGRELATALGVNPDLVDMGCLAHDLGHPPFGHNGESALNFWAPTSAALRATRRHFES